MAFTPHPKRNRLLAAGVVLLAGVWWWFAHDPGPDIVPWTISVEAENTRMNAALGLDYGVVLTSDGHVHQWEQPLSATPARLSERPELRDVGFGRPWRTIGVGGTDAQRSFALGVQPDGTLWQLWWQPRYAPGVHPLKMDPNDDWREVFAGNDFALLLKNTGELWGVGGNGSGQLGMGHRRSVHWPEQSTFDTVWVAVAAGDAAAAGVQPDGSLWAWGGKDGLPSGWNSSSIPRRVGNDTRWRRVFGGANLFIAENEAGEFWAWGISAGVIADNAVPSAQSDLIRLPIEAGATHLAVGGLNVFWRTADGDLRGIGFNDWSALGGSAPVNRIIRQPVSLGRQENAVQLLAGPQSGGLIDTAGRLRVWGLVPGWSYETTGSRFRARWHSARETVGLAGANATERRFTYKQAGRPATLVNTTGQTASGE